MTGEPTPPLSPARQVCIIYDCLFPHTIGGAERWYRVLSERLAREGHRVTYLTLRQWDDDTPQIEGVEVVAVGPRLALYEAGKRRIWPPLRFGWGVFRHLFRHGSRYSHVHVANFPFFSLLAVGLLSFRGGYSIGVDWHEIWTRKYWQGYLGRWGGWAGWTIQRWCAAIPQHAFVFSDLNWHRLRALGRDSQLLPGLYTGGDHDPVSPTVPPTCIYAGRMIPEKQVPLLVEAFALAHTQRPDLRLKLFGTGPERGLVAKRIAQLGLEDAAILEGFVDQHELDAAMAGAIAIVQPSIREGYGMVVVEANARGVPAIVVEADDNAATGLVEAGVNGQIAAATATDLARAMLEIAARPEAYRASTRDWFMQNRQRLSVETSMTALLERCGLCRSLH